MNVTSFSSNISGYITDMKTSVYGRIPIAGGGSATTYEADTINATYNTSTQYPAVVGGYYGMITQTGAFEVYMSYGSGAYSNVGTRLSCKPSVT